MGRFKETAKTIGKVADALIQRNQKIDEMSRELTRRGYGLDPVEARKVAKVLVDRAEVTWK
jgi:hypothetical protein